MNRPIEPGLLPVFRIFAGFQFIFLMTSIVPYDNFKDAKHPFSMMSGMVWLTVILILYLVIPPLERGLGLFFLPLAIFLATIIPFSGEIILISSGSSNGLYILREEGIALLLLPLLVISWQYRFPVVAVYIIGTGLADIVLFQGFFPDIGPQELTSYHRLILGRTLAFLAGGFLITRLMKEQRRQRRALAAANTALSRYASTLEQLTVSRERNRMARELHDTLAHTLSGMAVQLEGIRSLWDSEPAEARHLLDKTLGSARNGLAETRTALSALRAAPLEDMGLRLALKELADSGAKRSGLTVETHIPELIPELPLDIEHGVYRVAQEGLENAIRHAQASKVTLDLACENGRVDLRIADDGCGFNPTAESQGKYGLRGMAERAALLNGTFQVDSKESEGTKITLSLPVTGREEKE